MRIKRTAIVSVFAIILALITCISASAVTIPSPTSDFYVYDGANVIAKSTEKYIIEKNQKLEAKTGGQIVIVTVDSTGDVPISEYANTIFTQWKIGDQEKYNGLLLLLSIDKLDFWVTYGSGIQSRFSSENVKTMTDNYLDPYYLAKQYDKGVQTLFDKFLSSYEKMYSIDVEATETGTGDDRTEAKTDGESSSGVVTAVIVVLAVVLFIALAVYAVRKYSEAEKRAAQKQKQRQQQRNSQAKRRNPTLGQTYLPNGQTQKQSSRPRNGASGRPRPPKNGGGNRPTGRRQG